jgi:hypothetical protein
VSRTVMSAVGWFYAVELIAAAAGIVVVSIRSDRGKWWPICVLIISVQAAHLLYWTNARMRAPLTSAIALFAATAIPRRRAD